MIKQSKFPKGWDEERVKRVLDHYEDQKDDEWKYQAKGQSTHHGPGLSAPADPPAHRHKPHPLMHPEDDVSGEP